MTHPHEGGSYRRAKDESLTRVAFTDVAKPEGMGEAPDTQTTAETPPEETPGAKKGKS